MGREADGVYPAEVQPTAAMPEVGEPVTVSAFDIHLLTGADTPEEVVHEVAKAVYDNFEQLKKDYPPLRAGEREKFASVTNTVPYHPGAVAFFEEIGLWTDANAQRDQTLAE
jgi:uncharacterized protein